MTQNISIYIYWYSLATTNSNKLLLTKIGRKERKKKRKKKEEKKKERQGRKREGKREEGRMKEAEWIYWKATEWYTE